MQNKNPEELNYEIALPKYEDSYLFGIIIDNITLAKRERKDTLLINYPRYSQMVKNNNLNLLYQLGKYVLAHEKELEILGYKLNLIKYRPTQMFNEIQISW